MNEITNDIKLNDKNIEADSISINENKSYFKEKPLNINIQLDDGVGEEMVMFFKIDRFSN